MRTWRNEEQIVEKSHKGGEFCSLKYRLRKGMKKKKLLPNGVFVLVTHLGTNPAKQGSTLLSGQHVVLSLWYSDSERNCF